MSDGFGCQCMARCESECCCGVDWRSEREVELEAERYQLAAQNEALRSALNQFLDQEGNPPEDTGEWREVTRVLNLPNLAAEVLKRRILI